MDLLDRIKRFLSQPRIGQNFRIPQQPVRTPRVSFSNLARTVGQGVQNVQRELPRFDLPDLPQIQTPRINLQNVAKTSLNALQSPRQPTRPPIRIQNNLLSRVGTSPVGRGIVNFQNAIENQTLPKLNLTQYAQGIEKPVPKFTAELGLGLAENLANIPQRLLEGGGRVGTQIVRPLQEGRRVRPAQAVGAVASAALPVVDIATLGGGTLIKGLGQQAIRTAGKEGLKQAAKRGALQGAGYGAGFGGLHGLSEGQQAELMNFAQGLVGGGVLGAGFGAGAGVAGNLIGRVVNAVRKTEPRISEQEANKRAFVWIRDMATGKYRGVVPKKQAFREMGKDGKIYATERQPIKIRDWRDGVTRELKLDDFNPQAGFAKFDEFVPRGGKANIRLPQKSLRIKGRGQKLSPEEIQTLQTGRQPNPSALAVPGNQVATSGKSIAENFNTGNLNVPKKGKELIDESIQAIKPVIEQKVGKTLKNKEVKQFTEVSSKVLKKAVSREETLQWEAALLKARQQLADQAQTGRVTQEYLDNLIAIKTLGTDIGRKLQSFAIKADPKALGAKEAILEAIIKVNQNTDEILKASKGVDFNDLSQATAFYRRFVQPKTGDWVDLLRYNSMLSSPNTQIINIASNFQGTGLIAPVEKTALGGVDFLYSAVTGRPRRYFVGEGTEFAKGYYSNLGRAAKRFSEVMSGKRMIQNPDLRNIPLTTGGKGRIVENTLAVPMRLLEGMDQFFQVAGGAGAKRALDYKAKQGVKLGLDTEALATKEAAERVFRGELFDPKQGHVLNALDSITNQIFKLRSDANPVVSTIAKFTLPFVKTPMNLLKQGVEYSPVGFSTMWQASNKTEQFTKAIMGSSIALGTSMLLGSNRLTWAEPINEKQRNAFRAAGLQPYSVRVGNKWVSYSKLHPALSFNLALVAALKDSYDKGDLNDSQLETVLGGLSKWMQFYADQSYLRNIGDFINASKGSLSGFTRYVSNYPQQLIPFRALMSWVNRIIDPHQRQVDADGSILEKQLGFIQAQIPGLAQRVPVREDAFGEPIPNQNRFLNAFSPNRVTTEVPEKKGIYDRMVEVSKENRNVEAVKQDVENQGSTQVVGNKIVYFDKDSGEVKTINLDEYLKPKQGIARFGQENDKYDAATKIWEADITQEEKDGFFQQLGVEKEDVRYEYLAKQEVDVKSNYIIDKAQSLSHEQLLHRLTTGRVESVTGKLFVTNTVIDNLEDEGLITDVEAKALKKMRFSKEGKDIGSATGSGGGRKPALVKPPAFKEAPSTEIKLGKPSLPDIGLGGKDGEVLSVKNDVVENYKKQVARILGGGV